MVSNCSRTAVLFREIGRFPAILLSFLSFLSGNLAKTKSKLRILL